MKDSHIFRGHRLEEKLASDPGIYKVMVWDSRKNRYVDPRYLPRSRQKTYRVKKRIRKLGEVVQCSKAFDSLHDARDWRFADTDQAERPDRKPYTVGDLIQDWRDYSRPPRTKESTFEMLGKDIRHLEMLHHMVVDELSSQDIDEWLRRLIDPSYPKKPNRFSYLRELKTLRNVLNWYLQYRNTTFRTPLLRRHYKDAVFAKPPLKGKEAMTESQVIALLRQLRAKHKPVYFYLAIFQALTATRLSEACALMWDCVDFENRWITIRRSIWWKHQTKEPVLCEGTKTDEIRRARMSHQLKEMLTKWKDIGCNGGELVFHNKGALLRDTNVRNASYKAMRTLGFRFRPTHIHRHTAASKLLEESGNREAARSLLGHKSFDMTERYAHPSERVQIEAMDNFRYDLDSDPKTEK